MNEMREMSNTLHNISAAFSLMANEAEKMANAMVSIQNRIDVLEVELETKKTKDKEFKRKMAELLFEDSY